MKTIGVVGESTLHTYTQSEQDTDLRTQKIYKNNVFWTIWIFDDSWNGGHMELLMYDLDTDTETVIVNDDSLNGVTIPGFGIGSKIDIDKDLMVGLVRLENNKDNIYSYNVTTEEMEIINSEKMVNCARTDGDSISWRNSTKIFNAWWVAGGFWIHKTSNPIGINQPVSLDPDYNVFQSCDNDIYGENIAWIDANKDNDTYGSLMMNKIE